MKFKIKLIIFCTILCQLTIYAQNVDFTVDGVSYEITNLRNPATVKAVGMSANVEKIIIPAEVTFNSVPFEVTEIAGGGFSNNKSVREVVIQCPLGFKNVGLFAGCSNLQKATIPKGCGTIPEAMFEGCTHLSEFYGVENVKIIERKALRNSGIKSLDFFPALERIEEEAFADCRQLISIPEIKHLLFIGKGAFRNSALREVSPLQSLNMIGDEAFSGCKSLTTMPDMLSVISIGNDVFKGSRLQGIGSMPRLKEVGERAFFELSLSKIPALNSLKKIGAYAFAGNAFKEFSAPDVVDIQEGAFFDCRYLSDIETGSLDSIPAYCFAGCINLTDYKFPKSLKTIGEYAFERTELLSLDFPPSLTTIRKGAFQNMPNIEKIVVPGSVTELGENCFQGMNGVKSLIFEAGKPLEFVRLGDKLSFIKGEYKEYPEMPLEEVIINRKINWLGTPPYICFIDPREDDMHSSSDLLHRERGYSKEEITMYFPQYAGLKKVEINHEGGCYPVPFYNPDTHIAFNVDRMERPNETYYVYLWPDTEKLEYKKHWSDAEYTLYLQDTKNVTFGPRVKAIWAECFNKLEKITCLALTPPDFIDGYFPNIVYVNATLSVPEEAISQYRSAPGWKDFYNIRPVGIENVNTDEEPGIKPYTQNGILYFGNLSAGTEVEVFATDGRSVYKGNALSVTGLQKGLYIVKCGSRNIKIML